MELLYFLENLRNPVFDAFFSLITRCGEETIFMAVGMIFFWCVSKHQGYYLFCVGFFGTVLNQFLKMVFRIPRPWIKDPEFTIVGSAKEGATGYSFPSGHTQTSVGLFGGIAVQNRGRILRGVMIALCVLVPLSRMYLGVHTPLDVGVSVAIALALIFVGAPIFRRAEHDPRVMYAVMAVLTAMVVAFLIFVNCFAFPPEVYSEAEVHNLQSAQKNAYTLLGCMIGLIVLYTVERKWINFSTEAVWWVQIIKVVVGLLLVLAVKEVLRAPLDALFGGHLAARSVRYFCVVIMGGVLWPLSFRWLSKIGRKA